MSQISKISFSPNFSSTRVIQQSHPICNTIMLFGVIICLISVILLGIDGQFVNPSTYPIVSSFNPIISKLLNLLTSLSFSEKICQARAWILSTGFTLAFGAMFSKVWRVHRFTTKTKTDPKVRIIASLLKKVSENYLILNRRRLNHGNYTRWCLAS